VAVHHAAQLRNGLHVAVGQAAAQLSARGIDAGSSISAPTVEGARRADRLEPGGAFEAPEHHGRRRPIHTSSSHVHAQVDPELDRLASLADLGAADASRRARLALGPRGGMPAATSQARRRSSERAFANAIAPSRWPARYASGCSCSRFSRRSSELR
jgi:hypothetical protein